MEAPKLSKWAVDYIHRLETTLVEMDKELEKAGGDLPENEPHVAVNGSITMGRELARYPLRTKITIQLDKDGRQSYDIRYDPEAERLIVQGDKGIALHTTNSLQLSREKW